MLAPSTEITGKDLCVKNWLDNAGTTATSRTLKVKDEASYKALENNITYLPDNWKKGATNTTVLYKDNGK